MSDTKFNPSIPFRVHENTPIPCDRDLVIDRLYETQVDLQLLVHLIRCDPEPTLPLAALRYVEAAKFMLELVMPSFRRH